MGWKSGEDGVTKEQQAAAEKRREQLRKDLPMGNFMSQMQTTGELKMPKLKEMEMPKHKKYKKIKPKK